MRTKLALNMSDFDKNVVFNIRIRPAVYNEGKCLWLRVNYNKHG